MKKLIKLNVLPLSIIVAIAIGGGVVYAFTSLDFSSRAASWANTVCSQNLINSKNSLANNKTATICYNYLKNGEQDSQISAQQQSIGDIQNKSKDVWAYDSNNQKLGLVLDPSIRVSGVIQFEQIYNTELQKILVIDNDTNNINLGINVSYTGANCTGTPYVKTNGDSSILSRYNDRLLTDSSSNYWAYDDNPSIGNVQMATLMNGTDCIADNSIWPVIHLNSISSPIHFPIALPISYKYE